MSKSKFGVAALLVASSAIAENVEGVSETICATGQAQICFETGKCFAATPWELDVPDFVIIDTKKKRISTTEASGLKHSTELSKVERGDGRIMLQGIENGRAFSFTVHEATGRITAAISRDGLTVSVFGACTDHRS